VGKREEGGEGGMVHKCITDPGELILTRIIPSESEAGLLIRKRKERGGEGKKGKKRGLRTSKMYLIVRGKGGGV